MIDLTVEPAIPLAAATGLVPPARGGRRTHLSTLLRWIHAGARAADGTIVRLEALRLGGRWVTSREALQRFAERLTPCRDGDAAPTPRTPLKRQRHSERAARELEKVGL